MDRDHTQPLINQYKAYFHNYEEVASHVWIVSLSIIQDRGILIPPNIFERFDRGLFRKYNNFVRERS